MNTIGKLCGFVFISCLLLSLMSARKRAADMEGLQDTAGNPSGVSEGRTMLFDMSNTAGWRVYKDKNVAVELSILQAKAGRALQVTYNMGAGMWLGIKKKAPIDLSKYAGVSFKCRDEGAINTVEIKVEDSDGSVFGTDVVFESGIKDLKEVEIPFSSLEYWWGGDETLDLKKATLHFTVSKKDDEDEGGYGMLTIGQIELYK
ncbi:MAG: carbohydrate binding domain-containing protein [Elusimicrobiota bacterium]